MIEKSRIKYSVELELLSPWHYFSCLYYLPFMMLFN